MGSVNDFGHYFRLTKATWARNFLLALLATRRVKLSRFCKGLRKQAAWKAQTALGGQSGALGAPRFEAPSRRKVV